MMVSEVPLSRQKELALIAACELRPALAIGDSPVPSVDGGGTTAVAAAVHDL